MHIIVYINNLGTKENFRERERESNLTPSVWRRINMGLSCRKQRSLDRAYAKAIFDCEIRAHSNLCHSGTALAGSSTSHPQDVQCTLNICAICLVWLMMHADLAVLLRRGSPMTRRRWPAAPSPPVLPPPFLLDPLSQEPFRDPVLLVQVRIDAIARQFPDKFGSRAAATCNFPGEANQRRR